MLEYVLRHLGYIGCDDTTKQKVQDMMERGQEYLSRYDPGIDWTKPTPMQKGLLKDFCLYEQSNALDDFKVNYRAELLDLYHDYLSRQSEAENADDV